MAIGTPFGSFSNPEIDRESDLLHEIERLRAALHRIDGLNDNPAHFNPNIEAVLRETLG